MDLENESPDVSRDMVRKVLKENSGTLVECIGKGPDAIVFPQLLGDAFKQMDRPSGSKPSCYSLFP